MMSIFSIYDKKSLIYAPIFAFKNNAVAIRAFEDILKTQKEISDYPEDYSLVLLAVFNSETGVIEPVEPVVLAQAVDFVKTP